MNKNHNLSRSGGSYKTRAVWIVVGLLLSAAATIGVHAQGYAPEGVKGLYSTGKITYFWTQDHYYVSYGCGTWSSENGFLQDNGGGWEVQTAGGIGGCVFGSALYAFFTTTGGELQYVKTNPSNGNVIASPTTVAGGVAANGAAAAVVGNEIYVFTAANTFSSKDGTHFTVAGAGPDPATDILDAVTFYPPDDAPSLPDSNVPAAVMVVYLNGGTIQAQIFQGSGVGFKGPTMTLSNPLDYPVEQGNCILGTSKDIGTPGAKDPCIQFYGCTNWSVDNNGGYELGRWEYDESTGQWSSGQKWRSTWSMNDTAVGAAPWSEVIDATSNTLHLLQIVWDFGGGNYTANDSDYEVPMYDDPTYGWEGEPTATSTAAPGSDLAYLWTLVGVVLGPPPFTLNGDTDACPNGDPRSWVEYGKDISTAVSTMSTSSSTITVASKTKIEGGIGEASLDLSYAHAWTSSKGSSKTVSVSQNFEFSPCSESGTPGLHGWVIFDAPTLVTQQYKLYAYDYDHSDGSGTDLGQSIYATVTGAVVQQFTYFDLANPSGALAGMPAYPNSTDYAGWSQVRDWDNGSSDWSVTFGDTTDPQLSVLNLGGKDWDSYAQSDTHINSNGNSNSFGVKVNGTIDLAGFSQSLKVGYNGEWSTETSTESTITTSVICGLNLPAPPEPVPSGDVTSLTVQPFWLQAKTTKVPWIPTQSYSGDLPWCITWKVTGYSIEGGATEGMAAEPDSAIGMVRHGVKNKKDTYTLSGGHLSWLDSEGLETPIPISADQFDTTQGTTVSLNGHLFSADGSKGKWTRSGDTWTYKTKSGAKGDHFTLGLDFGSDTWSFDASSKTLDQEVHAADRQVLVELTVAGSYVFDSWLDHDVNVTWSHKEKKAVWQPYGVHEIDGAYDSQTGVGNVSLKGHLPKNVNSFGDVEIKLNGESASFPILATDGFMNALSNGGEVSYQSPSGGLTFDIDFGKGKWTASIQGDAFKAGMAPIDGQVRVQVLVGGTETSDQTLVIQKTTTTLSQSN